MIDLEKIPCNLCGSQNFRQIYKQPDIKYFPNEIYTVVECLNCGLAFVNPRPDIKVMSRYYPKEFFNYFDIDKKYHLRRYNNEYKYIQALFPHGFTGRHLDIGCANGDYPRYMIEKGWDVDGVEISNNAKIINDFKIFRNPFPEIPIDTKEYDVITAWAVIEHVHDPMSYFIKANNVLKNGGYFIFLVTNYESISSRFLYREDIPRHLYFFTENTIKQYLNKCGFKFIHAFYNNKIFSMKPQNWLFYLKSRILGNELKCENLPEDYNIYLNNNNLKNNIINILRYLINNPLVSVDRLFVPLIEKIQILIKKYGIMIIICKKY